MSVSPILPAPMTANFEMFCIRFSIIPFSCENYFKLLTIFVHFKMLLKDGFDIHRRKKQRRCH